MMMRTPLALLLALMLSLAPFAAADEHGTDDAANDAAKDAEKAAEENEKAEDEKDDDNDLDDVEREAKLEISDDEVQIKLERKSGDVEDEVKMVLDADEASMKVEYKSENATAEAESELKVRLRSIVEFADNASNGAYDPGEDEVVQTFSPEDLDWSIPTPEDVVSTTNVSGVKVVATGAFSEGGNLSFVLYVYGDFAVVNGTSLRPTDVKIDILVDDFPYARNDTQVALLFKTEQEAKLDSDDDGDAAGVAASANNVTAYFTWADEAFVDGALLPVHTTMVESEDKSETTAEESKDKAERLFWFAYARGDAINHDPVMGVAAGEPTTMGAGSPGGTTTTDGSNATPGAGALLVAGTVALVAIALRRRRVP